MAKAFEKLLNNTKCSLSQYLGTLDRKSKHHSTHHQRQTDQTPLRYLLYLLGNRHHKYIQTGYLEN